MWQILSNLLHLSLQRIREEKREERRRRELEKKRQREEEKRKRREEERRKRKEAEKQKKLSEKDIKIKVVAHHEKQFQIIMSNLVLWMVCHIVMDSVVSYLQFCSSWRRVTGMMTWIQTELRTNVTLGRQTEANGRKLEDKWSQRTPKKSKDCEIIHCR